MIAQKIVWKIKTFPVFCPETVNKKIRDHLRSWHISYQSEDEATTAEAKFSIFGP